MSFTGIPSVIPRQRRYIELYALMGAGLRHQRPDISPCGTYCMALGVTPLPGRQ